MSFKIIVAFDQEYGIGLNNSIPWRDKEDLKYFNDIMKEDKRKVIIMGRKTAESMPKKFFLMENNTNIVISSTWEEQEEPFIVKSSLNEALVKARDLDCEDIWIIGGGSIYYEALTKYRHVCSHIYYTIIPGKHNCDVFFPQGGNISKLSLNTGRKYNVKELNYDYPETPYLDLLKYVLEEGELRDDRTNTGTISKFGNQIRFSMNGVIPVITTKRVWLKGVLEELLFFISGKTDTKILESKGINIWKGNTSKEFLTKRNLPYREGEYGPSYGFQWRHWGAEYKGCDFNYREPWQGIDQLTNLIEGIKSDPFGRRHILSSWNVEDLNQMALPPCHIYTQFYVSNCGKYLDCLLYQRSADLFLGSPFNITSYCLLSYMIAYLTDKIPRDFIYTIGDAHIYNNHIEQVKEQLTRTPYHFPSLKILGDHDNIDSFTYESFNFVDYKCHPSIKAEMAI